MIFESRNNKLTLLHKAADYLSRSLRENLELVEVNPVEETVSFLSEAENILTCSYQLSEGRMFLKNFSLASIEEVYSEDMMSKAITEDISSFVQALGVNEYHLADKKFKAILEGFEQRATLPAKKHKVEKKYNAIVECLNVTDSAQWAKLEEAKPLLISFLKEHKDEVLGNKDCTNSFKLSNAVYSAFNLPQISYKDLLESKKEFVIDFDESTKSLYEMICSQELVRKELNEAKESFSTIWINNESLEKLASCIYAKEDAVADALVEAISDVPFMGLCSKADLNSVFTSIYEVTDANIVSKKDVKDFVHKIFEMKKPAKAHIIQILDEKYGVNLQNLKFVPTFNNLAKTQAVMFEVLSRLEGSAGILSDVLSEFARYVRDKGGVEVLQVNDFVTECLKEAEVEFISESLIMQYLDIPRLKQDLGGLRAAMGSLGGEAYDMDGADMGEDVPDPSEEMPEDGMEEEMPEEGMEEEMPEDGMEEPMPEEGMEEEMPEEGMEGEEMPEEGMEEEMPEGGMEGEESEFVPEEPQPEQDIPVGDDSESSIVGGLTSVVTDLEDLINHLSSDEEETEDGLY